MRVLFISYDGMTDNLGQAQVLPYLIGLSALGANISLISFEKKERYAQAHQEIAQLCLKHQIQWHPLIYTKKPPILSTLYDVWQMQQKAWHLHQQKPFDIVHCRSYIAALVGLRLKRKFGIKFIFDMRGFYADERLDGGIWSLKNPLYAAVYRFFKKKERDYFLNADYSISLTFAAKDEIHSWPGMNQIPIAVIPCCADLQFFSPTKALPDEKEAAQRSLSIPHSPKPFVLGYLGSVGTWYMADEMFAFFQQLCKMRSDALFLFISPDPAESIYALAAKKGISKEHLRIVSAKRASLPPLLSLMDASVFFIKPCFSKKASSPTKMGELMGMNIPLLCNAGVGDVERIIEEAHGGVILSDFAPDNLALAAKALLEMAGQNKQHYRKEVVERYYSLNEGVKRYYAIYQQLAPTRDDKGAR